MLAGCNSPQPTPPSAKSSSNASPSATSGSSASNASATTPSPDSPPDTSSSTATTADDKPQPAKIVDPKLQLIAEKPLPHKEKTRLEDPCKRQFISEKQAKKWGLYDMYAERFAFQHENNPDYEQEDAETRFGFIPYYRLNLRDDLITVAFWVQLNSNEMEIVLCNYRKSDEAFTGSLKIQYDDAVEGFSYTQTVINSGNEIIVSEYRLQSDGENYKRKNTRYRLDDKGAFVKLKHQKN